MIQANIHQAKTQLSKLIERAEAGEEVVIARNGKPSVRLIAVAKSAGPRPPVSGALHDRVELASDREPPFAQKPMREVVGCMARDVRLPDEDYLRRLNAEIAAEMLDTSKFDVELDADLEFIPRGHAVNLLLDSNVLVRMVRGLVGPRLAAVLNDPDNRLFVSIASLWELAVKAGKRDDFDLPSDFPARLVRHGCELLPITADHAWSVSALPRLHGDPFDRLLVAQALAEGLVLVTSDRKLAEYGVAVLRT